MSQSKSDRFKANAEECDRHAAAASDLRVKEQFRALAREWRALAAQAEELKNSKSGG
jgi:hypothetical protein